MYFKNQNNWLRTKTPPSLVHALILQEAQKEKGTQMTMLHLGQIERFHAISDLRETFWELNKSFHSPIILTSLL